MSQSVKFGNDIIGDGHPTYIIAEAGVNHNGDMDLARKLCIEGKKAGANCIKFQTFKAERIVLHGAQKAKYQQENTDPAESQLEMLKKLELSESDFKRLFDFCQENELTFLSTPYDIEDVDLLDSLGVQAFKVASGQVVEHHFLKHVAKKTEADNTFHRYVYTC